MGHGVPHSKRILTVVFRSRTRLRDERAGGQLGDIEQPRWVRRDAAQRVPEHGVAEGARSRRARGLWKFPHPARGERSPAGTWSALKTK